MEKNVVVSKPEKVPCDDASGWKQVAFSVHPPAVMSAARHVAHLTAAGNVYTFGSGKNFQLGHGDKPKFLPKPKKVEGLPPIKQVECGSSHTVALGEDGSVYTWGWGGGLLDAGALGHPSSSNCPVPKKIESLEQITQIASGVYHSLALTKEGRVLTWGRGDFAKLVFGGKRSLQPAPVDFLTDIKMSKIAAGSNFSAAVTVDGQLYIWGRDVSNSRAVANPGIMSPSRDTLKTGQAQLDGKVIDVACGGKHTVALTDKGRVYVWPTSVWLTPVAIVGAKNFLHDIKIVRVGAGEDYSAAVDDQGLLYTWGNGSNGCLGHGSINSLEKPMEVEMFGDIQAKTRVDKIFCGSAQIAALTY